MRLFKIFCWGLMISFLGTLPLGTLNVTAMQLGLQESIKAAFYFASGALLVEMIFVRISLVGMDWVRKQQKIMRAMEWITLFIVIALAVSSFMAATKEGGLGKNELLDNKMNRFVFGAFLSAINPIQIPFWFGWSTVLFAKKVLEPNDTHYNSYIAGIGFGTLLGNAIFIFGGQFVASKITNSQQYINWVIGSIFAITAIIQLIKLLRNKTAPVE